MDQTNDIRHSGSVKVCTKLANFLYKNMTKLRFCYCVELNTLYGSLCDISHSCYNDVILCTFYMECVTLKTWPPAAYSMKKLCQLLHIPFLKSDTEEQS